MAGKNAKMQHPEMQPPPAVSTESILITEKIDAQGGRKVVICYITGAFTSAEMYGDVKMALHGRLSEVMVNIARQIYRHNVIYEKGRPVLYLNLKNAIYRFLISELLLYERIFPDMRGKGFEMNHYDT